MPDPDASHLDTTPPLARAEWMLVGVLLLTGILLRCWQPARMALEHFDEGVYASNLYCPPDGAYPFRHLYAPPLLPGLLEWALILTGGAAGSVMAVNVAVGCLLIPSVWWVGRQWFGPVAGVSAAALATFSEVHILYSRSALTDGLLCLWLLWAVYWAWRALIGGTPAAILLAGLFASLAWWTKYNGWLTLAISGSGMIAWLVTDRLRVVGQAASLPAEAGSSRNQVARGRTSVILHWLAIATIAILGWLPYLLSLADRGGYAAVADNHARYFVGFGGWLEGLLRQNANLAYIESWWTGLGLLSGLILTVITWRLIGHVPNESQTPPRQVRWIVIGCNIVGAALVALFLVTGGVSSVIVLLTLVGLAVGLLRPPTRLACWMLAAWVIGLLVAVPLYHPYLRLTLPLIVACWLGTGLAFSRLRPTWLGMAPTVSRETVVSREASPSAGRERETSPAMLVGIGLAFIAVAAAGGTLQAYRQGRPTPAAWEDRRELRRIAAEILETIPEDDRQLIYVLGEPGMFFHLASQGNTQLRAILPSGDLSALHPSRQVLESVAIYAVEGPHSPEADTAEGTSWAQANSRLVREWTYEPSTLILLNEHSPEQLQAGVEPESIRLLRIGR